MVKQFQLDLIIMVKEAEDNVIEGMTVEVIGMKIEIIQVFFNIKQKNI
jgi:hypothetical protein